MKIKTVSIFINEVAILWDGAPPSCISFKALRFACPCALCSGEKDVFGNVYKGTQKLSNNSFNILRYEKVGLYGLRFFWGDNHHDGIYTYDLLISLGNEK